jgi:sulfur transfer complex TusBCD TusB component (DsrH family)|tara:strand:+ start:282 stop:506 length:225 start_codon:yes stop_codon:yes gene_type:complete
MYRRNKKRYAVVIDTYVYAENDYMARKIAHGIKRNITSGDHARVIEIAETPFASLQSRELEDISEPTKKVELPF